MGTKTVLAVFFICCKWLNRSTAAVDPINVPRGHIHFMTGVGTPSHFVAMGAFAEELVKRGHLFSWSGLRPAHLWDRERMDYPFLALADGNASQADAILLDNPIQKQDPGIISLSKILKDVIPVIYRTQYEPTVTFVTEGGSGRLFDGTVVDLPKPDLVLCDNGAFTCVDAVHTLKVPFMMVTHAFFFGVGTVPYLCDGIEGDPEVVQSLKRRLWNMVVPFVAMYAFRPINEGIAAVRRELGAPSLPGPSFLRWKGVSVLNTGSFFGLDEPRELGPRVHLVGPVIGQRVRDPPTIDEPLKTWLDEATPNVNSTGKGIVFVALGSMARLTREGAVTQLEALKSLVEAGTISGALIANKVACPWTDDQLRGINVRWERWVPQPAILAHPATRAFVSHGGQESIVEAIYNAVPILVTPNFGDQFTNGHKVEAAGAGFVIPKNGVTSAVLAEKLTKLIKDETGGFKRSMERLRILMHFAGKGKVERAADLIETELMVGNGHLRTLPERVGMFRAYNLDIYWIVIAVVSLLTFGACRSFRRRTSPVGHHKQA